MGSLTYTRMSKWQSAVAAAEQALSLESQNAKALYRKGLALAQNHKNDDALQALALAAELEPKDGNIRRELAAMKATLRKGGECLQDKISSALSGALMDNKGLFSESREGK